GHAAGHGGGVEVVTPQRRVGGLVTADVVLHRKHVGDEHVVVGAGIAGAGGGVAGVCVDEAGGLGGDRRPPPAPALLARQGVEVGHGGVALGVHDLVHVLDVTKHTELSHRLV